QEGEGAGVARPRRNGRERRARCRRGLHLRRAARRVSTWPSAKARRVLQALFRIGWRQIRQVGSHCTLACPGWPNYRFAFHDDEELGPAMLAKTRSTQV